MDIVPQESSSPNNLHPWHPGSSEISAMGVSSASAHGWRRSCRDLSREWCVKFPVPIPAWPEGWPVAKPIGAGLTLPILQWGVHVRNRTRIRGNHLEDPTGWHFNDVFFVLMTDMRHATLDTSGSWSNGVATYFLPVNIRITWLFGKWQESAHSLIWGGNYSFVPSQQSCYIKVRRMALSVVNPHLKIS
jgi:hypothetical protein